MFLRHSAPVKITERYPDRLVLAGLPHGVAWPLFGLALGSLFACVFGWLCAHHIQNAQWYNAVMTALGAALGMLFIFACTDVLQQRERLELDRVHRRGTFLHRSHVRGTIRSFEFPFERIAAVSLEKDMQSPGGGKGFPTRVLRCRLLLQKPRRAILLDETQNQRDERIRRLAADVSEFLGTPIGESGRWDDESEGA